MLPLSPAASSNDDTCCLRLFSHFLQVSDPVQQEAGINKYTSYKISTNVNLSFPNSSFFPFSTVAVIRRYSDFVWLTTQLNSDYPGAIVPPIPEKQAVSRFGAEFVEDRRKGLELFLIRSAAHPELGTAEALRCFLSADDLLFTLAKKNGNFNAGAADGGDLPPAQGAKKESNPLAAGMKWFNETKAAVTGKDLVTSPNDARFEEINLYVTTLEAQMKNVVTHTATLVKKGKETANGLFEFGLAFTLLGQSEATSAQSAQLGASSTPDNLGPALTSMGHTADTLSVLSNDLAEKEETNFEDPLHDYIRIIGSVKTALSKRVEKRSAYSNAIADFQSKQAAAQKAAATPGKEDKAAKAEAEMKAAQDAMSAAEQTFNQVSERLTREVERFKAEKAADMRKTVIDYINLQIEYNKKMESVWSKLIPQLENVNLGGGAAGSEQAGGGAKVRNNSEVYDGLVGV